MYEIAVRDGLISGTDQIVAESLDDGGALRALDWGEVLRNKDSLLCLHEHASIALVGSQERVRSLA